MFSGCVGYVLRIYRPQRYKDRPKPQRYQPAGAAALLFAGHATSRQRSTLPSCPGLTPEGSAVRPFQKTPSLEQRRTGVRTRGRSHPSPAWTDDQDETAAPDGQERGAGAERVVSAATKPACPMVRAPPRDAVCVSLCTVQCLFPCLKKKTATSSLLSCRPCSSRGGCPDSVA